jgi:ribonucleoside-triphosphate reductase
MTNHDESTEMVLFVRGSGDDLAGWDRRRIVDALVRETDVDIETAEDISREVESLLVRSGITTVTAPLVRELVDARLLERGLEKAWRMHARVGFPLYDVEGIIMRPNKENANIPHSPEATSLTLAEGIKKHYALEKVFSPEVGDAHLKGDIHIHNMGFIDRAYSSYQSLEYLKKFGLNLPNSPSAARPARHPEVLLAHMVRYAAALQTQFSGSIGWDSVNISFAPYISGMGERDVKQFAQLLIFEFSQQAVARGGQAIFTYLSLNLRVPGYLADMEAVGPGGRGTGKRYGDYDGDSRRLLSAILEVYMEGDGAGRPFFFPIPVIHVTGEAFKGDGVDPILRHAAELAIEKGNPLFLFDREGIFRIPDYGVVDLGMEEAKDPWRMRYASIQNVTLNLPRIGYLSGGREERLFELLSKSVSLAFQAHLEKKAFMERLLSLGEDGPLSLLTMKLDGSHYLRLKIANYLIGLVGLNELVRAHMGVELHESGDALGFGIRVVKYIRDTASRLGEENGIRVVLNQTPAESTSYRFARLDMRYHSAMAGRNVRGDIGRGEIYYTNSTHLHPSAEVSPIEKVYAEGSFHDLIDANPLTHIWIGGSRPKAGDLVDLLRRALSSTGSSQVIVSPDFTLCQECGAISRGLLDTCPSCGSTDLDGISRITNYMSKLSSWNKGKIGELHERFKNPFRS